MTRFAILAGVASAVLLGTLWFLVHGGPPAWFTVTFGLVLVGVTIVFLWWWIVAAAVLGLVFKLAMRAAERRARP